MLRYRDPIGTLGSQNRDPKGQFMKYNAQAKVKSKFVNSITQNQCHKYGNHFQEQMIVSDSTDQVYSLLRACRLN